MSLSLMPSSRPAEIRVKLLTRGAKLPKYMTADAAGADVFADFSQAPTPDNAFLQRHKLGQFFGFVGDCDEWNPELELELIHGGLLRLEQVRFPAGSTVKIPLGFAVEIPTGWVGLLKGRSGLASKDHDAHVAFVDADYRGEVCVIVHVGNDGLTVRHGDRVGQIAFLYSPQFDLVASDELSETERGQGGFGHTGMR